MGSLVWRLDDKEMEYIIDDRRDNAESQMYNMWQIIM